MSCSITDVPRQELRKEKWRKLIQCFRKQIQSTWCVVVPTTISLSKVDFYVGRRYPHRLDPNTTVRFHLAKAPIILPNFVYRFPCFPQILFSIVPYTNRLWAGFNGSPPTTNPIKKRASKKFMLLTGLYRVTCENWLRTRRRRSPILLTIPSSAEFINKTQVSRRDLWKWSCYWLFQTPFPMRQRSGGSVLHITC